MPSFTPIFSLRSAAGAARLVLAAILVAAFSAVSLSAVSLAAQQPAAPAPPSAEPAGPPPLASEPPPPPAAVFQKPIPGGQLAFLGSYAGQPVRALHKDKQFRAVMKLAVPRTEYHYGTDMPLSSAIDEVLDDSNLPISIAGGRFAMVPGARGPYLAGRGFMWFDMQTGEALGVFYFRPTNGEPTPTLTVFSRQLTGADLSISQLPLSFVEALSQWSIAAHIPVVSPAYFIPENGRKYVLIHDEDYCEPPPAPSTPVCEQLDANAADADMNAAYFMKETHNAADATAWMLGPDQVAWIGIRETRCGGGLACRITMTRARTRVLIGRPPAAPRPRRR
ncbi:MAG: hypothetical protein ACRD3N_04465 [Terracidiphilus sp.]